MTVRTDTELRNVTQNLIWLRAHYGISKKKMSRLLGIGIGSLNKLESGIVPERLGVQLFIHIHKQFGISPAVMLGQIISESNCARRLW